jgi:hypothetical protein
MMPGHLVKLVAVYQQQLLSIGCNVQPFKRDQNIPKRRAVVFTQCFVMISRDENNFFAMTRPAQNLLHDRILLGRPLNAATHCPEVDNVAYQKEMFTFIFPQKINQPLGLAASCTEMYV